MCSRNRYVTAREHNLLLIAVYGSFRRIPVMKATQFRLSYIEISAGESRIQTFDRPMRRLIGQCCRCRRSVRMTIFFEDLGHWLCERCFSLLNVEKKRMYMYG